MATRRNGPGTDGDVHRRALSVLAGLLPAMIGAGVPGFSFENDLTFVPCLPEARVPSIPGSPGRPGTACSATSACRSPPAGALRISAAGDVPALETLAAASILRAKLPDLRVRVVNVVDLMRLLPDSEHPHGLPDSQFNTLFTEDRPVIFAFHGYPWLVHRLTYRRRNHDQMHVRGCKEKGTTTTLTSASINPGNSCGALVNASGQVTGIPALAAASPQGGSLARSIGFATPFSLACDIARQIIASGRVITSGRAAPGALIATLTGPGRHARQDRDRRGHRREPRRQGRPACR